MIRALATRRSSNTRSQVFGGAPYVYTAWRGPVTGSSDGLTSYQWLCVNLPWAGANSLSVTAPGKHKQAPLCTNATARVPHGNGPRWRGVMKKWSFKRRPDATSVCFSPTSETPSAIISLRGHLRAPQHLLTVIKSWSEMLACLIANYRWDGAMCLQSVDRVERVFFYVLR
ncbi:unnamed protein product [Pleuronectes platessa]|uniref:Uncharacterized protein n=1 Tax=Pleuronectes platessa TaxID=8262 RepID=A0A9N7YD49_PLEPL|nr:unnamed protein product [Pleuronectes platessa]